MESENKAKAQLPKDIEYGRAAQEQVAQVSQSEQDEVVDSHSASMFQNCVTKAFQEHYYDAVHNSPSDKERNRRLAFLDELSKEVSRIAFHPADTAMREFESFTDKLCKELGLRLFILISEDDADYTIAKEGKQLKVQLNWELNALVRIIQYIYFEE